MKKKVLYNYLWSTVFVFFVAIIVAYFYSSSLEAPDKKSALFMTIGIDQSFLSTETSSYELQRASEHFSDIILGWTVEPSFSDEFNDQLSLDETLTFTGRRQEKQNLLFILDHSDTKLASALSSSIQDRITEYNEATNAGYVVAVERISTIDADQSKERVFLGVLALITLIWLACLTTWDYATRRRSSSAS